MMMLIVISKGQRLRSLEVKVFQKMMIILRISFCWWIKSEWLGWLQLQCSCHAKDTGSFGSVHQAVQIGTGFTAGKVTAVIWGSLALLPYIRQRWVRLYRVARNTLWSHTAGEASAAHCWLGALETEMSTARIGHRAVGERCWLSAI